MSTSEERLEQRLRALAAEADPPPEDVLTAARAAFALRDLDAELAALTADSWTDAEAVPTRAVLSDVRMLAFECGDVSIEMDVETDHAARTCTLRGMVVGDVVALALVRADARRDVPLDPGGGFGADGVAPGPVRLVAVLGDGRRVTTTWVTL